MKRWYLIFLFLLSSFSISAQSREDSLKELEEQQRQLQQQEQQLRARRDSVQRAYEAIRRQDEEKKQREKNRDDDLHPNRTVLAFHPIFLPTLGQIDVSIEQAISKSSSLYLELVYHDFNIRQSPVVSIAVPGDWIFYTGYRVELQYRYYLLPEERALYKLYFAPHFYYKQDEVNRGEGIHYSNANGQTRLYEYYRQYQAQAFGVGGNIGCQLNLGKHITFDPFIGFSYTGPLGDNSYNNSVANLWTVNPYQEGLSMRMNISFGFAF